jgi:hypothetical protein
VVTIKRIERNKRKFVTSVTGLEAFGLELKKVRCVPLFISIFPVFFERGRGGSCVWGRIMGRGC